MTLKYAKNVLVLALVTNFAQPSLAGQDELGSIGSGRIKSAMVSDTSKPLEVKNLPLILDAKNLKIDKLRDVRIENLDLKQALGPGSSGGGNICAFNITAASAFIVKNIEAVPFTSKSQRNEFIKKINKLRFYLGANLEVRGQSVNAINYPLAGAIVMDEKACEYLDSNKIGGPSFLLHELLGAAGIDDTTYQVSSSFAKSVEKYSVDAIYGTNLVICRGENDQVIKLSFAWIESGAMVYKIKTKNLAGGYNQTITGAIVINGQETDFSTPSRIAFSTSFGQMVIITAPEPFGTILEKVGSSMNVVVQVEDTKTNSKCTLEK